MTHTLLAQCMFMNICALAYLVSVIDIFTHIALPIRIAFWYYRYDMCVCIESLVLVELT